MEKEIIMLTIGYNASFDFDVKYKFSKKKEDIDKCYRIEYKNLEYKNYVERYRLIQPLVSCLRFYIYETISKDYIIMAKLKRECYHCKSGEYLLELNHYDNYYDVHPPQNLPPKPGMFGFSSGIAEQLDRQSEHKLKFTEQTTVKELYDLIDKFLLSKNLKKAIKKDNN